jgi:large subunit ribosomal protein L24
MTQPKFKIKKGDLVLVTTGKNKGQRGKVKQVLLDKAQIIVDNINVVVRNVKPDYRHPEGSFKKELPISISNVALIDPSTDKPAKVGYKLDESGKKVRFFKKSGTVL